LPHTGVLVAVGVGVSVAVSVGVGVGVSVAVAVSVGVGVAVSVGVAVTVGHAPWGALRMRTRDESRTEKKGDTSRSCTRPVLE
jgi:hypothetical protein